MEERYTDIRLVKVPIEIDNKNQLNFSSATTQYNYFNSCDYIELENSSYQRKDNIVRYPGHIDDLIGYNYCMYKNSSYSNKWFYAFISDMQYINDSMTLVSIKTDVWQTWQFDIDIKKCFVEREHVNDDTIGAHTIPEGLETGDYIIEEQSNSSSSTNFHVVLATTYDVIANITGNTVSYAQHKYNGINSGCYLYIVHEDTTYSFLTLALGNAQADSKADGIVGIYMLPDSLLGVNSSTVWDYLYLTNDGWSTTGGGLAYCAHKQIPDSNVSVLMETINVNKPYTTINGYTPKNNKLFVMPYKYLSVDNNSGNVSNLSYEYFSGNSTAQFKIYGDITPGGSIRLIPQNYKNQTENNSEGLTSGKYPIGSFSNDLYTNWLTQNAVNIPLKITGSIISAGAGVVTGNPIGVASGILGIASTIGEIYEHSLTPPQVEGNVNSGDVTFSSGLLKFTFYKMSIKAEMARVLDDFFSMFGYKVNSVKIPNITGRTNWNYVKTIDCNIHGYIPQKDCIEIKNMFNAGVTFWHNPSTFLDYSQSNTIVSGS